MKLILTSVFAVTLATSAFAGKSDVYNDMRLDTAMGHVNSFAATQEPKATAVQKSKPRAVPRISSRNAKTGKRPLGYAYANPYGVGPHNDSR